MPTAITINEDDLPIGYAYGNVGAPAPVAARQRPVWARTDKPSEEAAAARARMAELNPEEAAYYGQGTQPAPQEKKAIPDEASEKTTKPTKSAGKRTRQGTTKSQPAESAFSTPAFSNVLADAQKGDQAAIGILNNVAGLNGIDKIEIGEDGGIYFTEDGKKTKVDPKVAEDRFNRSMKMMTYYNGFINEQQSQQPARQQSRAIPTEGDPSVYNVLRAKALLKADAGDLMKYQALPTELELAKARAAYWRAGGARGAGGGSGGGRDDVEFQYLDDGTTLVIDKHTKQRRALLDENQQPIPLKFVGRLDEYEKEYLSKWTKEVEEDDAQLVPNGTLNPDVILPNGRKVSWNEYQIAKKEGGFKKGHGNVGTASTGGK